MNKKSILIIIGAFVVLILIFFFLFRKDYSSEVQTKQYIIKAKNDYTNFKMVKSVSCFVPFYFKVTMDAEHLKNYSIVNDLYYVGYYKEDEKEFIYLKNSNGIIKVDPKENVFLDRYYTLNVSNKSLIVLDINDGSIKLIVPEKIGGTY
ncbi:hypothetical protein [Thermosipho melanesiensis]|uniref:Uncharacterized protein n=2 Tax=Thermosipho melanesiensis TaxID=46541 RepID=A6LNT2_THEM4|nr:hypothetical protein [Thermosipho melanesiensis]ABR31583.1 hypothetical protein Tmel_1744 [Thermosipho melanesiensis BI429]APT74948.1 hypothetical protein BW47_09190 [Thermosipho melanesiensis]